MIRWIVLLVAGAFVWAACDFLILAISTARSGLGVSGYGPPLMLAVVLFGSGVFIIVKISLPKRGHL